MSWTRQQDTEWRVAVDSPRTANANASQPERPASSWAALDLSPIIAGIQAGQIVGPVPQLMARSDGVCLLYPGEVHSLAGEPESGKGWAALHVAKVSIHRSDAVLYLDFEDAPASIVTRLLALGADEHAILEHFAYVRPVDPFAPETFYALTKSRRYALAVIDGVSEAYALLDLDPYSNVDAAKFLSTIARPIAETGAAVLLIDHVVKSKETRGRYAIGAQHKLAGIAAAYSTDVIKNPSRTEDGLIKLKVEKDRHGHVRGHAQNGVIVMLRITPVDDGATVTVTLDPPDTDGSDGVFRPTVLMARVAELVSRSPGATRNVIRTTVKGRGEYVDKALSLLIAEGYIERRKDGQAHAHYTLRTYENQPSPTESQPSPGNSETNRVPGSPPLRDPDPGLTTTENTNRVPGPTTHEKPRRRTNDIAAADVTVTNAAPPANDATDREGP